MSQRTVSQAEVTLLNVLARESVMSYDETDGQLELFPLETYKNYCGNCGVVETVIPGIYCDACCDEIVLWLEAAWGEKL